jgi:DNA-binding GntR family transcriptional regulator
VRVPHVGARVVSLSHAELIELYEIRESLEGMACRLAAERMSVEDIDELRRCSTPMSATPRSRPASATTSRKATSTSTTGSFRAAATAP